MDFGFVGCLGRWGVCGSIGGGLEDPCVQANLTALGAAIDERNVQRAEWAFEGFQPRNMLSSISI